MFCVWIGAWNEEKFNLHFICGISLVCYVHFNTVSCKTFFWSVDLLDFYTLHERFFFLPEAFNKCKSGQFLAVSVAGVIIFFWCVLIESCFLPCLGLLAIWRWNQRLKSTAGCNHLDNWDIWEDEMLQWGEPWAFEDSVCTGSLQTPEEARPVPSCEHLCPSVLVWPKHWQEWRGGENKVTLVGHILPQ